MDVGANSPAVPDFEKVYKLMIKSTSAEPVLTLWHGLKTTMTGGNFVKLLDLLVHFNNDLDIIHLCWFLDFVKEFWERTPQHLKDFVFQHDEGKFIFGYKSWFGYMPGMNFRNDAFLVQVLQDAPTQLRVKFWTQEWKELIIDCVPMFFRQLIETCLTDLNVRQAAKKEVFNTDKMQAHFRVMYDEVCFPEFNQYVDIFLPDAQQRREFKVQFLQNNITRLPQCFMAYFNQDEWIDIFGEFVDEAYGEDKEAANSFKRAMILLYFRSFIEECLFNLDRKFGEVVHFGERLCHMGLPQVKNALKEEFKQNLNYIRAKYPGKQISSHTWEMVLKWCYR